MGKLFGKLLSFRIVDRHEGTEREPPCLPNLSFTIIILFLDWVFALPNIEGMRHADLSVLVLRMLILVETLSAQAKHMKVANIWSRSEMNCPMVQIHPNFQIPQFETNRHISPQVESSVFERSTRPQAKWSLAVCKSNKTEQETTGNNTGNKKCEKCEKCDITMSQCLTNLHLSLQWWTTWVASAAPRRSLCISRVVNPHSALPSPYTPELCPQQVHFEGKKLPKPNLATQKFVTAALTTWTLSQY